MSKKTENKPNEPDELSLFVCFAQASWLPANPAGKRKPKDRDFMRLLRMLTTFVFLTSGFVMNAFTFLLAYDTQLVTLVDRVKKG